MIRIDFRKSVLLGAALVAGGILAVPSAHAQTVIFDNADSGGFSSNRAAGSSPLAAITVSANTTINAIAVRNDLNTNGNLKFLIYQNPGFGSSPVFTTAAKAFLDDGDSYKMSDLFSYTLLAGNQYYIGATADVGGLWAVDFIGNTQNGITSTITNGNTQNYQAPTFSVNGATDAQIRLYQSGTVAAVPEPSEYAVGGVFGATLLFGMVKARRKKATATA